MTNDVAHVYVLYITVYLCGDLSFNLILRDRNMYTLIVCNTDLRHLTPFKIIVFIYVILDLATF